MARAGGRRTSGSGAGRRRLRADRAEAVGVRVHHVTLDQWSRGASALHRRDPRVKIAAVLAFLVVLATAHREFAWLGAALFAVLCAAADRKSTRLNSSHLGISYA